MVATPQNANWPAIGLQWDPTNGPGTTTRRWVSLSARLRNPSGEGASTSYGRSYELNQVEAGLGTFPVANKDEALNPSNTASPYYNSAPVFRQGFSLASTTNVNILEQGISTPFLVGSLLVMSVSTNPTTSVTPLGATWIQYKRVVTASQVLTVWVRIADGGEQSVGVATYPATDAISIACAEFTGVCFWDLYDVAPSAASRVGSASATQATGTTAATTVPNDLVVHVVAPHGFAAGASAPVSFLWSAGAAVAVPTATGSATATQNSIVAMAYQTEATAGHTEGTTATWTNNSTDAIGTTMTFKAMPQIVPGRPIREFARWPSTVSGNLLNATNDPWNALHYGTPALGYADTAGFEGGTVGCWVSGWAGTTLANSVTRAHDGTKSMLVTWPTATSGTANVAFDPPPVDTGDQVTVSAWVYVPSGGSPAVALKWGASTGTASAVTNAWTRISVTVTRADAQDDRVYLVTAGASTAGQQVWVDSVQFELGASATAFQTTGATVYGRHVGNIERYPESWTHNGFHGWTKMGSVDPLAALAVAELQDCMTEDIMQDNPVWYSALSDGALTNGDMVRYSRNVGSTPTVQVQPFPGAYSEWTAQGGVVNVVTPGASGGPGVDALPCLQLPGLLANGTFPTFYMWPALGYGIVAPATMAVQDVGAGLSYEIWVQTSNVAVQHIAAWAAANATNDELEIATDANGKLVVTSYNATAVTQNYQITNGSLIADGRWHLITVTERASAGTVTATVYQDGVQIGTATYARNVAMQVQAVAAGGWFFDLYGGSNQTVIGKVARVAIYPSALAAARVRSHWLSSLGFPYDTGGQRIARILGWVPWYGPTAIDTGVTQVSPAAGLSGKFALAACQDAALAENSPFLATSYGVPTLLHRDRYYAQTTATWILGELENAYQADVGVSTDVAFLYSQVRVTGSSGVQKISQSSASIRQFQARAYTKTVSVRSDADAQQLAHHWLAGYQQPRPRLAMLTINPAADPTLWPMALGAKVGDRVTFRRRTYAGLVQFDGFIDRVETTEGTNSWKVKYQIGPVDMQQAWVIGNATYGVVGSTARVVF